nr:isochorismatase family cysteine hydrolase [uncultured Blautia sp.]
MKSKCLVIVDVQNDFVSGALGTEEAQQILPKVIKKAESFQGKVVFTMDTHGEDYLETQEGRLLPVKHCIKGTDGWKLAPGLEELQQKEKLPVFEKTTFGSKALAEAISEEYSKGNVESVELVGLCTDICVISNALLLKAYMPELKILVDPSCCAGVTIKKHLAALETMNSCQIETVQ